jgi:hypothetical protein
MPGLLATAPHPDSTLSGFAPLAASAMMEWTGMLAAPAAYIAACTVLSLISSFALAKIRPSLVSRSPETVAVAA